MTRSRRVLVVDDEERVREVCTAYLERDGFTVRQAADAAQAREALAGPAPDLVILDIMFPGSSGLELLDEIRRTTDVPVILLSALAGESERVSGLELGADDYVVKPFSPRELVARVRSVLRRSVPPPVSSPLEFDGLTIDVAARVVVTSGRPVELTAREFDLLAFLASRPGQVFSRGELLAEVWDSSPEWQDPATVTVHVRRVRRKIEADPTEPRWLRTAWGVGYRFDP